MIDRHDLLALPFYKKSAFTGSEKEMCYRIERIVTEEQEHFQATLWPGPYCYDKTGDDVKITHQEDFSEAGLVALIHWMNETYQTNYRKV